MDCVLRDQFQKTYYDVYWHFLVVMLWIISECSTGIGEMA